MGDFEKFEELLKTSGLLDRVTREIAEAGLNEDAKTLLLLLARQSVRTLLKIAPQKFMDATSDKVPEVMLEIVTRVWEADGKNILQRLTPTLH